MDIDKLENPFIKVTWEDIPENFTQEKIKRVRSYFQNKYNSKNVTVLTRAIDRNSGNELDIDLDQNVMDTTYQRNLMSRCRQDGSFGSEGLVLTPLAWQSGSRDSPSAKGRVSLWQVIRSWGGRLPGPFLPNVCYARLDRTMNSSGYPTRTARVRNLPR